jgi:hypothetical protein
VRARLLDSWLARALAAGAVARRELEKPMRRLGEKVLDLALEDSVKSTGDRFTPDEGLVPPARPTAA